MQTHYDIGHFFAHCGRAGGLAVGAAEHGDVGVGVRHVTQFEYQAVELRQQHQVTRSAQLQCVAGVVDVFAGAGEVHEFGRVLEFRAGFEFGLQPVLHCFDIVVGRSLYRLDGLAVSDRKILHQAQQVGARPGCQGFEFGKTGVAQGDEPCHFNLHTPVHVAELAGQGAQGRQFGGVPAVQRGKSGNCGKCHGYDCRLCRRPILWRHVLAGNG